MNHSLKFLLTLATAQNSLNRRFDGRLSGLSLSEFMILYHLSLAEGEKMRRVDLAGKIGLTASGVTRLLLPMEKIGLIKREAARQDERISYTVLAAGGKRKLEESTERAELFAEELVPAIKIKKLNEITALLEKLG